MAQTAGKEDKTKKSEAWDIVNELTTECLFEGSRLADVIDVLNKHIDDQTDDIDTENRQDTGTDK